MGSKTNRSLQRNHVKAKKQRQELGALEALKPAYRSNKPMLREIAASCQMMVKPVTLKGNVHDYVMVLYNPAIHRERKPVVWSAYVDCDNELYRF